VKKKNGYGTTTDAEAYSLNRICSVSTETERVPENDTSGNERPRFHCIYFTIPFCPLVRLSVTLHISENINNSGKFKFRI
jgi:hypothetical protein